MAMSSSARTQRRRDCEATEAVLSGMIKAGVIPKTRPALRPAQLPGNSRRSRQFRYHLYVDREGRGHPARLRQAHRLAAHKVEPTGTSALARWTTSSMRPKPCSGNAVSSQANRSLF